MRVMKKPARVNCFSHEAVKLLNGECNGLSKSIEKTVKVLTGDAGTIRFAISISRKIEENKNKALTNESIKLLGQLLNDLVYEKVWESERRGHN